MHGDNQGPEGSKLRLERIPVCSSILVDGLNENTCKDTIQLYFESNGRSGGDIVSHVERITKSSAVVHFEKASGSIVFHLSFRFLNIRRNFQGKSRFATRARHLNMLNQATDCLLVLIKSLLLKECYN